MNECKGAAEWGRGRRKSTQCLTKQLYTHKRLCTQTLTTEVAEQWFSDDQGNIIMIYVGKIKQQDVSDAALHFTKFNLDSFY